MGGREEEGGEVGGREEKGEVGEAICHHRNPLRETPFSRRFVIQHRLRGSKTAGPSGPMPLPLPVPPPLPFQSHAGRPLPSPPP